jgi:Flp pilus assembly protein TadG
MPTTSAAGSRSGERAGRRAHHHDEAGQATVEFALILPFVVLMLLAIVQVGFVARDYVRVAHASREAARAASVDPNGDRSRDVVRHLLGDADVQIERAGSGAIGDPITATVKFRAKTEVPVIGALIPDVEISESTTMRAERE